MTSDPTVSAFAKRRSEILLDVSLTAAAIEAWLKQHSETDPTLPALAEFEMMLVGRRASLEQLMALDDEVVTYLIKRRSGHH